MSGFPILGDAMFDHLVKVVTISYLHCKGSFFPSQFVVNLGMIL